MTRTIPGPSLVSERAASIYGALLVALGPISMALYTPAMPELVAAFGTSLPAVKATLTAYFAGFALAQLVCGPLSDGFGRRRVALGFLALYLAASVAACFAPTVGWLIAARLVQGVGAAAGVAISRAIVRDCFTGQQSARVMNTIGIFLALGPALSPTIGGIIMDTAGWQAIFAAMVVYGLGAVAAIGLGLPETNRDADPARAAPAGLVRAYRRLIVDRRFLRPSLVIGLTIGGLYANSTMLPFVLIQEVGLTPTQFGLGMIAQSGSFIVGGLITRQLLLRVDATHLVMPGLALCAAGGIALALSVALLPPSFPSIMAPVGVFAFALAFFMPALTTEALAPFPAIAGAAAALMGFLQMGGGFLGSLAATLLGDPLVALGIVVPAMTVAGFVLALAMRR